MNDTDKCVAVLTRCGPFSHAQAKDLVPKLSGDEVAALVALELRLAKLDAAHEEGVPGDGQKPEPWQLQKELNAIGVRFRAVEQAIADRQAQAAKESTTKGTKSTKEVRKAAVASPIVGTGEP